MLKILILIFVINMSRPFVLEDKIDEIIEMIIDGHTFRQISTKYECSLYALHNYLSLEKHSARVMMAQSIAADTYAEKAEEVLQAAEFGNMPEITRARELAQHYRWKASKTRPKKYGEKIETTINPINADIIIKGKKFADSEEESNDTNNA